MKVLIRCSKMWGVPAYEWLDARSTVKKSFTVFTSRVPADFAGTQDIQVSSREIQIIETGRARKFQVTI
jgi:hypothetical protein